MINKFLLYYISFKILYITMGCLKIKEKPSENQSNILDNDNIALHYSKYNEDKKNYKHFLVNLNDKYETFHEWSKNNIREKHSKACSDINNNYYYEENHLKSNPDQQIYKHKIELLEQTIQELKINHEELISCLFSNKFSEELLNDVKFLVNFYHHKNLVEDYFVSIHHLSKCLSCKKCEEIRSCKGNKCHICNIFKEFLEVLKKVEIDCKMKIGLDETFEFSICQKSSKFKDRLLKILKYYKRQSKSWKKHVIDGRSSNIMNVSSELSEIISRSSEKGISESNFYFEDKILLGCFDSVSERDKLADSFL